MKKALIGIAFLFAGLASAQVTQPSNGGKDIGHLNAVLSNTGSTTTNYLGSVTIPAGSLSSTGKLAVNVWVEACTGSGTPYASCSATNTGTCGLTAYLGTSSGSGGTQNRIVWNIASSAGHTLWDQTVVRSLNSASSQDVQSIVFDNNAGTVDGLGNVNHTFSMNSANPLYLNLFLTNSVSGDSCFISQADVTAWP